jgi:hypothetical protein
MGMYDARCMLTGLPLTANAPATAVLLTGVDDGYRPATLGLRGSYNCYGTIDEVREDVNAGLIWAYVTERLADGRLVVSAGESLEPTGTIDDLLEVVERNQLEPAVTLDGASIHHALIYQPAWDALCAGTAPDQGPVDGLFQRLFGESPVAGEIYRGRLADVAVQVRQLGAISDFLAARGLHWAPPGDEGQRYPTELGSQYDVVELRSFVEEARRDAGDVEVLRAAIDEADRGVAEREEEGHQGEGSEVDRTAAVLAALMATEVKQAVATDEDGGIVTWPPA